VRVFIFSAIKQDVVLSSGSHKTSTFSVGA